MHAEKSVEKKGTTAADRKNAQPQSDGMSTAREATSVASQSINFLQKKAIAGNSSKNIEDIQRKADMRHPADAGLGITVQPKLTIGEPGDPYEKEADKIASEVVRDMHASAGASNAPEDSGVSIQKKALEEEELQMKPSLSASAHSMPAVQLSEDPGSGDAPADFESAVNAAKGGGQSLDEQTSQKMGSAMGSDFSGVKVHTDSNSDHLSRSIQARAFTTGSDVFFRKGEYDPGSKPGQELLAHELTHVVQQGAAGSTKDTPVQKKSVDVIQRAMEEAFVNDTAQLHTLDATTGQDQGVVRGGKKVRAGDEIMADNDQQVGEWMSAEFGGKTGYVRKSKVVLKSVLAVYDTSSPLSEGFSEVTDLLGSGTDTASGGMETGTDQYGGVVAKSGFDIASGVGDGLTGLFGMIASAKELISGNQDKWESLESGFGFVSSAAKGASGVNKVVDNIAHRTGSEAGAGESGTAGKYLGAIADGLGAVKDTALGVIGLYKLFKVKSDSKAKDALAVGKSFTSAALSAAKVAKNAYDIIGNGIPMALIYTIPALSIAVSAINVIIRLADSFSAGDMKAEMEGLANTDRGLVAASLGESEPTEATVDSSEVFFGDRRGTFPHYKTYFRTKKEVRAAVKKINTDAENEKLALANKIGSAGDVALSAGNKKSKIDDHKTDMEDINVSVPVSVTKHQDLIQAGVDARNAAMEDVKASVSASVTKHNKPQTAKSHRMEASLNRGEALKEIKENIDKNATLTSDDKIALYKAIMAQPLENFTEPFAAMQANYSNPADISLKTAEALAEIKAKIDAKASLTDADKTALYTAIQLNQLADFTTPVTTEAQQRHQAFLSGVVDEVRTEVDTAAHLEGPDKSSIKGLLINPPGSAADYKTGVVDPLTNNSEGLLTANGLVKLKANIDGSGLTTGPANKLKGDIGTVNNKAAFDLDVDLLKQKDVQIDQYELGDKLAEINDKRKVSGWTDVVLELVSMAGDITTIAVGATGIGAAIGQGMKAGAAGVKAVHSASKFVQKVHRNRGAGDGEKSTSTKHKEYVNHAKFIYKQIAALTPGDTSPAGVAREGQIKKYIRATGVNYEMWESTADRKEQLEMMVNAMKKRS